MSSSIVREYSWRNAGRRISASTQTALEMGGGQAVARAAPAAHLGSAFDAAAGGAFLRRVGGDAEFLAAAGLAQ